jgi:hypothetical protein
MTSPNFDIFVISSPLKRIWSLICTNVNSLYPRIICTEFDGIWPAGSGEEDLRKKSVYFHSFAFISNRRGTIPFIWTNLNPLPKDDLCHVWLKNWPSGSGEEDFLNDSIPFLHLCDYLPFKKKDLVLYLNKLEFSSPKDNVYKVWLKLACWFWRRRFSKYLAHFYSFAIIFTWRGAISFISTNLNFLSARMIYASWSFQVQFWYCPPGDVRIKFLSP